MKTTLIPIGNSRGVRIPKPFIEQCGLTTEVEMDVRDRVILIHSSGQPRAGWSAAFTQMARIGDDTRKRTGCYHSKCLNDMGQP